MSPLWKVCVSHAMMLIKGDVFIADTANNRIKMTASVSYGDGKVAFLLTSIRNEKSAVLPSARRAQGRGDGRIGLRGTSPGRRPLTGHSGVKLLVGAFCALFIIGLFAGVTARAAGKAESKAEEFVWPLPPEQPRVKFLKSVTGKDDVRGKGGSERLKEALFGEKKLGEKLKKPYGVYADRDGRIFVTDTGWGKVLVFDFKNKKFLIWGESGKGALSQPAGITSDSSGRIYVTDLKMNRAVVYDKEGNFIYAMGKKGELEQPAGIAVNEKLGRVYIVDTQKHLISIFNMEGDLVSTIGERGTDPGQFNFPTNLTLDKEGKLYVVDSMNFRVQILDPDGKFLKTFGSIGDAFGQFSRPKGIAVDSEGHIYVADAAFNNFQIFDQDGQLLLFVGSLGKGPGQFWLPAGMYIDGEDRIYVADQYNYRIQVFQYLREQSPVKQESAPQQKK